MTPEMLLRTALEAAIVAQFTMVAIFQLASPPRLAPTKLLLVALAITLGGAASLNALASTGVLSELRRLNIFLEMAMGPIIFMMVSRLGGPGRRLAAGDLAHFLLPAAACGLSFTPIEADLDFVVLAVTGTYGLATIASLASRRAITGSSGVWEFATLLTTWLALTWMLRLVVTVEARSGGDYRSGLGYPAILLAVVFLSSRVLYLCLRDPDVLSAIQRQPKYAGSYLTQSDLLALEERLRDLLDRERIYRDSTVSLEETASRLAATPRELSQLTNSRFGEGFPALINRLRVEEAAQRLADTDDLVTQIMLDVGFGSKSAFQREFSKRWRVSPTDYRARARAAPP